MADKRDYYEVLGVHRDAAKDDFKRAYRKLALQYHPDKNKSADAEERFKELSEAYAVLSDDEKRALYDRFGHAGVSQRYSPEDIFRGADFQDIFGDLGRIFESFFGGSAGFPGGRPRPEEGRDLLLPVTITLDEAYRGVTRTIPIEREAPCEACEGRGAAPGTALHTCSHCHGRGQVQRAQRTMFGSFVQVSTCPNCQGSGSEVERPCSRCRGRGHVPTQQEVEVSIPPGAEDGGRLRLSGLGEVATRGGAAGDLYVQVRVRPHPRFARDGPNLLTAVPVDYPTLVLGGKVPVETLEGDVEVEVPPGSQPGQRLRVRGHGMPTRQGAAGDLYLQLQLHVPPKPNKSTRELLERLRDALHEDGGGWFGFRKGKTK